MTRTSISVKVEGAPALASKLERVATRARFAVSAVDAVNAVTKRADESLRKGAVQDINLTAAYVKSKTDVALAAGGKARATISVNGDLTVMGNFGPVRVTAPGAMRRAGPIKGRRSAGVDVAIRRGKPRREPQWFLMRLRQGTQAGTKFGAFVRDDSIAPNLRGLREGKAGKRHVYGPSPYALMREQIGRQRENITDDLRRTALREMGDDLQRALK